jgi:SMODS and SLOG-associating 2TM effector domain 3
MTDSGSVQTGPRQKQIGHYTADGSGKVALRLRIGITGHRDITAEHPGLTTEIANAVEYIIQRLAVDPDRIRSGRIALTAVSSLAEGADRLVAYEILKRNGSQLEIVLPLPPEDYCRDFSSPASVAQFDKLRKRPGTTSDTVQIAESRERAYELAGRAVVDRSDVMIVVWDGKPARGRGGTAEIYSYAQRWQKPIVLISIDDDFAKLDADHVRSAIKGSAPLSPGSMMRLDEYNKERLPESAVDAPPPLLAKTESTQRLKSSVQLTDHISYYFARADLVAMRFQRRWFRATRLLYSLAPLAVLVVAAQVTFWPSRVGFAWFEFAILVVIIAVLIVARSKRWHQRWVSARYLAEQIRSLLFLALTGIVTLEKSAAAADGRAMTESSWTERAANEIWFTRPRYVPDADISDLIAVLYEEWIKEQQQYHIGVSRKYSKLSARFQAAAVGLFGLSALFALLHSLGAGDTALGSFKGWDFLAIVIPGIAAALGGYGAQRDYLRHAERSKLFAATLDSASDRLLTAGSLQDVQQAALSVSRAMRSEATDWYTVVHSQDVELPS